jgi:lipopolysaccharide transport system ATP-binding protein
MSDIAIRVENLSKRYRIGRARQRHDTLRDALVAGLRRSLGWLRGDGRGGDGESEDTIWALKDVSFEVKRGEVVGIIGRNGAGKSTLLKILSRITEPTEGRAEIHGRVGSLLEVGTGFHPELTGRENVYLSGAILGMKRAEIDAKFDEIVAFAEVDKFLDTPFKHYSSGMKVRLGFAVAAHLEPEILLVDEVLAVGDAAFQKKCLGKMGDVAGEGRTVLFVSHNMAAVKQLCSRALLLRSGMVVCTGSSADVTYRYLSSSMHSPNLGQIAPETHRGGSGKLRFDRVNIISSSGHPVREILLGEEFTIALYFSVWEAVRSARVGVGISTIEGVRIATLVQTDCGMSPLSVEPGMYKISVVLRNFLLPGNYVLDVGAHETLDLCTLDFVQRALGFSVAEISRSGSDSVPYNATYSLGVIAVDATWVDIEQLD